MANDRLPLVAVVGRPNVGKSALVNRIAQTDDAIVHSISGVTRDRSYHRSDWGGMDFMLIDTGGIEVDSSLHNDSDAFQAEITTQAYAAVREADVIVFLVDGKVGVQAGDEEVAKILRRSGKPAILAVNKMDNPTDDNALWEFMSLGLGQPYSLSALHGYGTGDLLDAVVDALRAAAAEAPQESTPDDNEINVAIIGRPNAGKSTLSNLLVENERSIVSPVAGTTRDAVDTVVHHGNRTYRIVDTAGLRHKTKISESVEYFGFVRAMRAIERADVVLLVLDAQVGLTNEDQRIADYAHDAGRAMALIVNKWDTVRDSFDREEVRERIEERLPFVGYAPRLEISAKSGKGTGEHSKRIWDMVDKCYANFTGRISTSRLNNSLQKILEAGHTVSKKKTQLRIKYATQTGTCPPVFTFFCNRPDIVTDNFKRFLENSLRDEIDLVGTPVRLRFRKKD